MIQSQDGESRYVIVAGVDFSEVSELALDEAARLAEQAMNARLHVVHVVPVSAGEIPASAAAVPELTYMAQVHRAAQILERWLEPHRRGHAPIASHVCIGHPAREIAQLASDLGAKLVVVGTHGRQGLTRLLLGSVAEKLVRYAPCPVLVYRPREVPPWEQIEPPCPDCLAVQHETGGARLWCARHAEHHARAHTYRSAPEGFGLGAQTFRSGA